MKILSLALMILVVGCDTQTNAVTPAQAASTPSAARGSIDQALGAYESARAALAKDSVEGLDSIAKRIAESANAALPNATEIQKPALEVMAKQASVLATLLAQSPGIDGVRKQFGEVSRGAVQLLTADVALRAGRWIFECPMADGYQKWVQVNDKIENPYMGSSMLECGGPVRL